MIKSLNPFRFLQKKACDSCYSGCVKETEEDEAFHGLLTKVAKSFEAGVSFYDIPKLYNPSIPAISTAPGILPMYTLCQIEQKTGLFVQYLMFTWMGKLDQCSEYWKMFNINANTSYEVNPYEITHGPLKKCGSGIGDVAK